jgi:mannose-6-phosphate isomerase-like protein (cupin superfamily)
VFLTHLPDIDHWFKVLQTTSRSQTAVMNLAPGKMSGDEAEAHPKSDQILVVLEGEVVAEVGDERAKMRAGDMVVIPAGIRHRFRNDAKKAVRTVSVYAPPTYPPDAEE